MALQQFKQRLAAFINVGTLGSLAFTGCSSVPDTQSVSRSLQPLSAPEALALARIYIVASRGPCGTEVLGIQDHDDHWKVRTTFGINGRAGPDLQVHKITRSVTLIGTSMLN